MEGEIETQPGLLEGRAEGYFQAARAALGDERPELVLLAARGSSDNAGALRGGIWSRSTWASR